MNFVPESVPIPCDKKWNRVMEKSNVKEKVEDDRPLYERLKEQRERRYEIVVGLDEDDADYLNDVAKVKSENEKKISDDDNREIQEFRNKSRALDVETNLKSYSSSRKQNKIIKRESPFHTQKTILSGIKRKAINDKIVINPRKQTGALNCVAILPGIPGISEFYSDDSTSESDKIDSSDSSDDSEFYLPNGRDFIGRKIIQKCKNEEE